MAAAPERICPSGSMSCTACLKSSAGIAGRSAGRLLVGAICNLVAGQLPPVVDPRAADPAVAVEDKRGTQIGSCRADISSCRALSPLTRNVHGPLFHTVSWPDGRCRVCGRLWPIKQPGGGKSGLHGDTVAANGRRGRPQGKCHRKQTACAGSACKVRVKGCGKSAPRGRQRRRQGKPHREQDQIGVAGRARKRGARSRLQARHPGWLLEAPSNGRPRRMAVAEGQPSRQNPAYRPAGNFLIGVSDCAQSAERHRRGTRSVPERAPIAS